MLKYAGNYPPQLDGTKETTAKLNYILKICTEKALFTTVFFILVK